MPGIIWMPAELWSAIQKTYKPIDKWVYRFYNTHKSKPSKQIGIWDQDQKVKDLVSYNAWKGAYYGRNR